MNMCNSCGGIIGRDCFNPVECEWITQEMNKNAYQEASKVPELEKKIEDFQYELLPYMQQIDIDEQHIVFLTNRNEQLKQHLNAVITAHEKMRKQYHIKEQSNVVTEAKKHLKSIK